VNVSRVVSIPDGSERHPHLSPDRPWKRAGELPIDPFWPDPRRHNLWVAGIAYSPGFEPIGRFAEIDGAARVSSKAVADPRPRTALVAGEQDPQVGEASSELGIGGHGCDPVVLRSRICIDLWASAVPAGALSFAPPPPNAQVHSAGRSSAGSGRTAPGRAGAVVETESRR
jgi:hypothetical protein